MITPPVGGLLFVTALVAKVPLMKMVKEHEVKFVDFRFTDPRGKWQHVTFDVSVLDADALNNLVGQTDALAAAVTTTLKIATGICLLIERDTLIITDVERLARSAER